MIVLNNLKLDPRQIDREQIQNELKQFKNYEEIKSVAISAFFHDNSSKLASIDIDSFVF